MSEKYEELVELLRDKAGSFDYDGWIDTAILLSQAADAIEDLEFACNRYEKDYKALCEYLPKWIPVTERLPEKSGKYLCNIKRFSQYAGMQYYYVDVLVFQEDYFFEDGIGTERITHWMPLPEPPKEEGKK